MNPLIWNTKLPVKKINSINELVKIGRELGHGAFGKVYEGIMIDDKGADITVAVKEQDLKGASHARLTSLQKEINTLYKARNCGDHVPKLYDVIYDSIREKLYFIMDLVKGKDLKDFIIGPDADNPHPNPVQTEKDAMKIILPLMDGLICLHRNHIAHRDIKLANAMIDTSTGAVKWIDFGLSCVNTCPTSTMGTASTMAPEVIARTVNPEKWRQTDLWSFGCLIYTLVTQKRYPLQSKLVSEYTAIKKGDETTRQNLAMSLAEGKLFESEFSRNIVKDFPTVAKILKACLTIDPDERQTKWDTVLKELNKSSSKKSTVYLDTPSNRKLNRVGLTKTRATSISRTVYADTADNRRKGRVGTPIQRTVAKAAGEMSTIIPTAGPAPTEFYKSLKTLK